MSCVRPMAFASLWADERFHTISFWKFSLPKAASISSLR